MLDLDLENTRTTLPILESKGMRAIFQEKGKKGKNIRKHGQKCTIFENILKKGKWLSMIVTRNNLLEKGQLTGADLILDILGFDFRYTGLGLEKCSGDLTGVKLISWYIGLDKKEHLAYLTGLGLILLYIRLGLYIRKIWRLLELSIKQYTVLEIKFRSVNYTLVAWIFKNFEQNKRVW